MKLNQKSWTTFQKQKARQETIINTYRKYFYDKVPDDKQYWTICGQCATEDGQPFHGSEIDQVIKAGLITEAQFHGVEREPAIHEVNKKAFPYLNLFYGDFYRVMYDYSCNNKFNPAIVNADLIQSGDSNTGAQYISKIIYLLTKTSHDVMLVANFIIRMKHYNKKCSNYIMNNIQACKSFELAWKTNKWEYVDYSYEYTSPGSRTDMGTYIFIKKN